MTPRFACRLALPGGIVTALVLLLVGVGCGARAEYDVAEVRFERAGWDTLGVRLQFARRTVLGGSRAVRPDTLAVYVFDAGYDTLYAGPGPVVPVPDRALGSREPLLVEACGAFAGQRICQQQTLYASPKRVRAQPEISYPEDGSFQRGSFDLRFVAEREQYGQGQWERIDPGKAPTGYLLAYVKNQKDEPVRIPFRERRGRFDLTRYQGYNDFEFYLRSALFDAQEAVVVFDVYAGLGGTPVRVAEAVRQVRMKTPEERVLLVRHFARQAVDQIVEQVEASEEGRRIVAYIDGWEFDRFQNVYTVELEMRWRGASRGYRALSGVLKVDGQGRQARFRRMRANRTARRLWPAEGEVLHLEPLDPDVSPEEELDEARAPAAEKTLSSAW